MSLRPRHDHDGRGLAPAATSRAHGPVMDPGWLYLIAGAAMLVATVLIPAADDLTLARNDRALAESYEAHRAARLANYRDFADRLSNPDDALTIHLARTQLNLMPEDFEPVYTPADEGELSASVLPDLEPEYTPPITHAPRDTKLRTLTTDPDTRLWIIAGSGLCILIGLLPATRRG